MKLKQKIIALVCALALCLGLITAAAAEDDVTFISLNDYLFPLATETMPFWEDGLLYIPVDALDVRITTISLGFYAVYSDYNQSITIYDFQRMIIFDLAEDSCYDYHSGEEFSVHAIVKNGTAFVPASTVCNFFGLKYNVYTTDYGEIVRITNGDAVLSDWLFIDAASYLMSSRLRDYNQSLVTPTDPTPTTPTTPVTPTIPTEPEIPDVPEVTRVSVYLGIRCDGGTGVADILAALEEAGSQAIFFLTPDQIATDGNLVRQLLGTGHLIGILAEGETTEDTQALLAEGNRQLALAAYTTTTLVLCPTEQRSELIGDWVFWRETASFIPTEGNTVERYGAAIIRSLNRDDGEVYLTLDDSADMGTELESFIDQLAERSFVLRAPLETRL